MERKILSKAQKYTSEAAAVKAMQLAMRDWRKAIARGEYGPMRLTCELVFRPQNVINARWGYEVFGS